MTSPAPLALVLALAMPLASLAVRQELTPDERVLVLAHSADELPRADPDRWSEWSPSAAPPEEVRLLHEQATRAYASGDLVAALARSWAALEILPDWPPALQLCGVLYFRLHRHRDAVEAFQRFLVHAPREIAMTRALGHSLYALGRYEEALAHYERVLESTPEMVEALRGAALAHYRLGDSAQALGALARVIELSPDHQEAWLWRAQILFELGRADEALPAALRARELDPYDPSTWHLAGQLLLDLGKEEEARAAEARFHELEAVAAARRRLEGILLFEPERNEARADLARLCARIGDARRMGRALTELIGREPESIAWRRLALELALELHDAEGARAAAGELESRAGSDSEAWLALERFFGSIGDRAHRVRAGEHYLRLGGDPAVLEQVK